MTPADTAPGADGDAPRECSAGGEGIAGRSEGGPCGSPASKRAGDLLLCELHFGRLMDWVAGDAYVRRVVLARIDLDRKQAAAAAEAGSVVYCIRRTRDGMIKIGYTTRPIGTRIAQLMRMYGHYGHLQLLVTTEGGRPEEREAHLRFRQYRHGNGEWFCPVRPLLEWICEARGSTSYPGIRPDRVVPPGELERMALAAPPHEVLRWDASGYLQWPPAGTAA